MARSLPASISSAAAVRISAISSRTVSALSRPLAS